MSFIRSHPGLFKVILLSLIIILTFIIIIHNTLLPVFFSLAEVEAIRIANRSISQAVNKEIEEIKYNDLITYKTDQDGNIVLMQPNIREINRFSSRVSINIQENLEKINNTYVNIPFFKILGMDFLAALGPDLKAKIMPAGFVHPPAIKDSFETGGINQTRHKIYLNVIVKLKLIVPFSRRTTTVNAEMPVIEVTILGKVPKVYVGLGEDQISGIINNTTR